MAQASSPPAAQPAARPALELGAAWYPEQWPQSAWDKDLTLMEQAHFTVARIGEFAWSSMEPTEGHYDFAWMERAIRMAETHHIAIVIGTPTDAPPAWLTQKYPAVLGTDSDGHVREHGTRRQFSYSSPLYRRFCIDIALHLAQKFGHDPNVIGWQIGNEITDESFDAATRKQFQDFLRAKYGTLDSLNQRWTTAYWSQTYTDWSQIPLTNGRGNPGLLLDHKHFVTATWRSFLRAQIDAIKSLAGPHQFITTNIGGLAWSDNWDHYAMNEDLSLASWDDYVGTGHLDANRNGFMNDFVRGWKRKNFWVMETQPGTVNWSPLNNALDPGETRAMAWQDVAHGADAILYWQWRSALNGQEQYHGCLVGPDGEPLPIYNEIKQIGEDFRKAGAVLQDTTPHADVALLVDYDSRWAIDFQAHSKSYDQLAILLESYRVLAANGRTVDVVSAYAPLDEYKLVVAPSLNVIPQKLADHLTGYVRSGGQLILGPRSGMKDAYDALDQHLQPGPLADLLGAHVEQFYALDVPVPLAGGRTASIWAEPLATTSSDAHVVFSYGKTELAFSGHPAVVERSLGTGSFTYVGTLLDDNTLQHFLAAYLAKAAAPENVTSEDVPSSVEVSHRGGTYIVINHSRKETTSVKLLRPMHDVLTGSTQQELTLAPQAVAVLTEAR